MELRHLRYFIAVAEELHFGRAARRLGISQPPLSQQILALEAGLGVKLLDRGNRQVRLTRAGSTLLASARQLLESVDVATEQVRRVHHGNQGTLRLGHMAAAALILVPDAVNRHRKKFPHVTVSCQMTETVGAQFDLLRAGSIDVGIVRLPVRDDQLVVKALGSEPMLLAVPESHRLAGRAKVSWSELRGVPFIYFPRHVAPELHDHVTEFLIRKGVTMDVAIETPNFLSMLGYVAAGLGIALVLESAVALQRSGVRYVRLASPPQVITGVAYRPEAYTDLVPAFVATLRESIKAPKP